MDENIQETHKQWIQTVQTHTENRNQKQFQISTNNEY